MTRILLRRKRRDCCCIRLQKLEHMVAQLSSKLDKLLDQDEKPRKKSPRKLKNVVELLNLETNHVENYFEWIKAMEPTMAEIEYMINTNYIDGVRQMLVRFMIYEKSAKKIDDQSTLVRSYEYPIRCFEEKKKIFYVFDGLSWRELETENVVKLFKSIYLKMMIKLTEYQDLNKSKNEYSESKNVSKLMTKLLKINITQDSSEFLKLRLFLYKFLKN